jgi:alcohol dehydrogenase (cytochrome c)/quinohemoprotein ethanol dehydrogenase
MLADLPIGGRTRRVVMQAPKNGFFYVLDAASGELLSAKNYAPITWAKGVDMKTGRPIEDPESRYGTTGKMRVQVPGPGGAHSWNPMAFNPRTGLVYIPVQNAAFPFMADPGFKPAALGFNTGVDFGAGAMPADTAVRAAAAAATTGALVAWDPVTQKARWTVDYPGPANGGLLSTAGNLVFQGSAGGNFAAFTADTGRKLWQVPVQTGVIAAPMTYTIGGEQYVALMAGWGGVWTLSPGVLSDKSGRVPNISRLIVFKLGARGKLPPAPAMRRPPLDPPPVSGTPAQIAEGAAHFGRYCGVCHGDAAVAGPIVPDLRRSAILSSADAWKSVTQDGALKDAGMVSFAKALKPEETEAIRLYVIKRANEDKALGET